MRKTGLKVLAVFEFILLAVMLLFLLSLSFANADHVIYVPVFLSVPMMGILLGMGLTAYRNHQSAVLIQVLGWGLLIILPNLVW